MSLHNLTVDTDRVPVGDAVKVTFTLEPVSGPPADVVIDYRVHDVGARATKAPRVFKLARRRLEPAQPVTLTLSHRLEHVSIRRIRPGPYTIDVQVNGYYRGASPVVAQRGRGSAPRRHGGRPTGGELIHEAALAMRTRMFTGRLAQTTHAYPTWSTAIQQAAAQYFLELKGRTARPARPEPR